jgi:hypothetical protein
MGLRLCSEPTNRPILFVNEVRELPLNTHKKVQYIEKTSLCLCSEPTNRPIMFANEVCEFPPDTQKKFQYINHYKPLSKSKALFYDIQSEELREKMVSSAHEQDSERKPSIDSLDDNPSVNAKTDLVATYQTRRLSTEKCSGDTKIYQCQASDWISQAMEGMDSSDMGSVEKIKSLPDLERVELQNRFERESKGKSRSTYDDKVQMTQLLVQVLIESKLELSLLPSCDDSNFKLDL